MLVVLLWLNVLVGMCLAAGTLLSFSDHPHWFVRGWDFPRVQIACLALVSGAVHAIFFSSWGALDWFFLAVMGAVSLWQGYRIYPYTPLARKQVQRTSQPNRDSTLTILISNVEMENQHFDKFLATVRQCDPDLVLALEIDRAWETALKPLEATYPQVVRQPQSNFYGMMLFSRLPIAHSEVRFLVQDDIPSIHAEIELPCGERVHLHGLHPRPPEPIRDQDSKPRDAELVIVGKEIGKLDRPTIVAGDLNDVAWSPVSRLFLRLSGLLDARKGRGLYNTWNANHPLLRFPLDHVFHSHHFKLIELKRMPHIGSDHFPVYMSLSYEPEAQLEQPETEKKPGDDAKAAELVEREASE
jgi:endonuclease/exonuclease/phosphatase (EEP) superfamily protein YafD